MGGVTHNTAVSVYQALGCSEEGAEQSYQVLVRREEPLWFPEAFLSAVVCCLTDKQGVRGSHS